MQDVLSGLLILMSCQLVLAWCSEHFKLNVFRSKKDHMVLLAVLSVRIFPQHVSFFRRLSWPSVVAMYVSGMGEK